MRKKEDKQMTNFKQITATFKENVQNIIFVQQYAAIKDTDFIEKYTVGLQSPSGAIVYTDSEVIDPLQLDYELNSLANNKSVIVNVL